MGKSKRKASAADFASPRDRDEADEFIYKIGEAIRDRGLIQAALDDHVAAAKAAYEKRAEPINAAIERLTGGLQAWCEDNRAELLADGGRTVKFGNGEVAWRARPASVTIRGVEKVIEWCLSHRWTVFLRFKTEIDKEAMRAHADAAKKIPGVKIASAGEDFIVTPLESKLEDIA